MFIQHIRIENFGAICFYEIDLAQELNLIDSRYADEILATINFLLCNKSQSAIPEQWLQVDTQISATIRLADDSYFVNCNYLQLIQLGQTLQFSINMPCPTVKSKTIPSSLTGRTTKTICDYISITAERNMMIYLTERDA